MEHAVSMKELAAIIGFKEIELYALRRELAAAKENENDRPDTAGEARGSDQRPSTP